MLRPPSAACRLAAGAIACVCAWAAFPSEPARAAVPSGPARAAAQPDPLYPSTLVIDSTASEPVPPPIVQRSAEWETLSTLPEEARFRPIVGFRYNRVDGPAATVGGALQTGRTPAPLLMAQITYAYSRERLLGEAGFAVPFGDRPEVLLSGSVYRRTATEDEWIITEGENTIFALLARTDYRDHYESEGGQGWVAWSPGSDFELRGGARIESQRSLSTRTRVSLTGRHPVFRPNPPIQEGDDQTLLVGVRLGPAEVPILVGTRGDVLYERSGDPLEGDFEYGRVRGSVRHRSRLSRARDFRVRLIAGSTLTGSLPVQKVWHVGGIGTLRGHDYKSFAGDQFFVGNAEFYQRARKNIYPFVFVDTGAAWFGSGNLDRQRPALDAGLGVRIAEGPLAVTVAKNLRDGDSKPLVGVRLGNTF